MACEGEGGGAKGVSGLFIIICVMKLASAASGGHGGQTLGARMQLAGMETTPALIGIRLLFSLSGNLTAPSGRFRFFFFFTSVSS